MEYPAPHELEFGQIDINYLEQCAVALEDMYRADFDIVGTVGFKKRLAECGVYAQDILGNSWCAVTAPVSVTLQNLDDDRGGVRSACEGRFIGRFSHMSLVYAPDKIMYSGRDDEFSEMIVRPSLVFMPKCMTAEAGQNLRHTFGYDGIAVPLGPPVIIRQYTGEL